VIAIRTNAAAVMLGVSASTLRSWERRYGFPQPQRSAGGHRQYAYAEVEALRLSLAETHNVSSAIALARERGDGLSSPRRLAAAYEGFEETRADRLLEESLTIRSVERTVEELLLPAVELLADPAERGAEYELAWRHASGWLSAMKRLAAPAYRPDGVLVLDATSTLELDALYAQALELALRRGGLRTLCLSPVVEPARLGRAIRALKPRAIVLTGAAASLDTIGRLVYAVRSTAQGAMVLDYRGAVPDTGASTVLRLGQAPMAARDALLERLSMQAEPVAADPAVAAALLR
jgi:DNA-binding transcriptional MerR regulator